MPMQLVLKTVFNQTPLLLIQAAHSLDIYCVRLKNGTVSDTSPGPSGGLASTDLVARVKCKASRKIICSTISLSGTSFAYSDHVKPNLFELKRNKSGKSLWTVNKRQLPKELPFAHYMVFSSDSSRLILAGHDRRIYVVDVGSAELVHAFTPCRKDGGESLPPSEPPLQKCSLVLTASGLILLESACKKYSATFMVIFRKYGVRFRQHWFISRLDGASVTAGGFTPQNSNVLIICTSSNQKISGVPGEVIGLSFQPSSSSSSVIVYSPRAMCMIDFGMPVDRDDDTDLANGQGLTRKLHSNGALKRKLHGLESKQW
ncbi:UNVERIFIED_CONTAM: WD repeat-containing protein PCN [Sesamum latifolium]|uniref:WD repeat-containing protein PCN n=1 Tax=Sesamum latifolium TaxID=2727402 RepID=A0AAW2VSI8_9LAMI